MGDQYKRDGVWMYLLMKWLCAVCWNEMETNKSPGTVNPLCYIMMCWGCHGFGKDLEQEVFGCTKESFCCKTTRTLNWKTWNWLWSWSEQSLRHVSSWKFLPVNYQFYRFLRRKEYSLCVCMCVVFLHTWLPCSGSDTSHWDPAGCQTSAGVWLLGSWAEGGGERLDCLLPSLKIITEFQAFHTAWILLLF